MPPVPPRSAMRPGPHRIQGTVTITPEGEIADHAMQVVAADAAAAPHPVPTDPRHDSRPDPSRLFSRDFVDVPDEVRARCIRNRAVVSTGVVYEAWAATDWHAMRLLPLVGASCILAQRKDFLEALPHLGTARVAYHAERNWVCREYGFVFAAIVAAELECNAGIVCDDEGHHLYSFVPVLSDGQVECLIVEPQADRVVPHTDPSAHYVGKTGFALLI